MIKIKTLYISDLDGTLLDENAELPKKTAEIINKLIKKRMYFSVATARTQATVVEILENLEINVPAILMNGVVTLDIKSGKYYDVKSISKDGMGVLFDVIENMLSGSGFLYCIDDEKLSTYYANTDTPNAVKFIEERRKKYNKKFTRIGSMNECSNKNVVYYSIENTKDKLVNAYESLKKCGELHTEFYRDIYETNHWYLEVSSSEASKKNAVKALKEKFDFDRVVSFGDNLNDLPMFEVSDESYAVENAKDEVKAQSDGVIEKNTENAVALYLESIFE